MAVSSVSFFPAVSSSNFFSVAAASATSSSAAAAALSVAATTASTGGSALVEFSGPGQLFAAVSAFRSELKSLQQGLTAGGIAQDFPGLTAAVQRFVTAVNTLQGAFASSQATSGDVLSQLLAGRFEQALGEQEVAAFGNRNSSLTLLSQLGISLQPLATSGSARLLNVDLNTLQTAFASDRAGTLSLLQQAAQSFGNLADNLESQIGSAVTGQLGQATGSSLTAGTLDLAQRLPADTVLNTLLPAALGTTTTSPTTPASVLRDLLANPGFQALTAQNLAVPAANAAATPTAIAPAAPADAASRASLTLQNLLQDAAFQTVGNAKDPAFAAVVTAPRLSEFVLRAAPVGGGPLGAGATTAVAAITPQRPIAPQEEADNRMLRNAIAGTS